MKRNETLEFLRAEASDSLASSKFGNGSAASPGKAVKNRKFNDLRTNSRFTVQVNH